MIKIHVNTEMDWTLSRTRDYKYNSVQYTDDKRRHGRPTLDVNIKINLREIMCEEMGLIHVIQQGPLASSCGQGNGTSGFHRRRRISRLVQKPLSIEKRFSSMEFISYTYPLQKLSPWASTCYILVIHSI